MSRPSTTLFAFAAMGLLFAATPARSQDFLMVVETSYDSVMLFSAYDGTLLDQQFIPNPGHLRIPINAVSVGDEILVSDQLIDGVFRFDARSGAYLGRFNNTPLDNVRGLEYHGGLVYVTNAGTGGGAPGEAVAVFDVNGNQIDVWTGLGSPFDVHLRRTENEFLINDVGAEVINRFGMDGEFLGTFDNSSGMVFPQQMFETNGGSVLVAGFEDPSGIYEFDASSGALIEFHVVNEDELRGVYLLGNGNYLFTCPSGVFAYDPVANVTTPMLEGVSARFIEPYIAVPEFTLETSGACPGPLSAIARGATPRETVALVFAFETGAVVIQSGPCAGVELGLGRVGLRVLDTKRADQNGVASFSGNPQAGACGRFIQAVDMATCTPSNVARLP